MSKFLTYYYLLLLNELNQKVDSTPKLYLVPYSLYNLLTAINSNSCKCQYFYQHKILQKLMKYHEKKHDIFLHKRVQIINIYWWYLAIYWIVSNHSHTRYVQNLKKYMATNLLLRLILLNNIIIIDTSIYINLHTYYILIAQFMGYVSQMIYVKTEKTIFICWNYYFFILCNKYIHSYGTVQVRYSTLHFCDVENVIRYKYLRIRYTKFFLHFCNIMIIVILHFFK